MAFWAVSLHAFTPEAEWVLGSMEEGIAAGRLDQGTFDAFVAEWDEETGCDTWNRDLARLGDREILAAVREACPDLAHGDSAGQGGYSRMGVSQSVRPRSPTSSPPFLRMQHASSRAGLDISLREGRVYRRHGRLDAAFGSLHAGHLFPDFGATRLSFVSGRRFFAGNAGESGPEGPWSSAYPGLDGLGANYLGDGWTASALGAWNQLRFRSGGETPRPRRDALVYGLGWAQSASAPRIWRGQILHQRFETAGEHARSATVAGLEVSGPAQSWRVGLACSRADFHPGGAPRAGGYAEAVLGADRGTYGSYRVEARQASPAWANPLQGPPSYSYDTLEGEVVVPGRGEGALSLRTRFPLAHRGTYRLRVRAGGGAAWKAGTEGLLAGQANAGLSQTWGGWTCEIGSALRYRRAGPAPTSPGTGLGMGLGWEAGRWMVKASLRMRDHEYNGNSPRPLSLSVSHRQLRGNAWTGQLVVGESGDPLRSLGLFWMQSWRLGRRAVLGQVLRLPWSRLEMTREMGYQVRLDLEL